MDAAEASARTAAAAARIAKANPVTALMASFVLISAWLFQIVVYLCVGFGVVATAGISMWLGLPASIVVAQTLGRFWNWWRRDVRVKAIEACADAAEKQAEASK